MTSRERVEAALQFKTVDRVPVDLNLSFEAYKKLVQASGFSSPGVPKPNLAMEVCADPDLYEKVGVDCYSVKFGMGSKFDGEFKDETVDAWGIGYKLVKQQYGMLYEIATHPLQGASIEDLETIPWPSIPSDGMKNELNENVKRIYETTGLALCGRFGAPIMEVAVGLLGFEEWFVRLMTEPEFITALLDRIESIATLWDLAGIEACGEYLSIMKVSGEDFGAQQSLLYSPETIRKLLLPVLRRRWDAAHKALDDQGSKAKVMLHTCGAVKSIIPDFIEAGIEILDPLQPKAADMDPQGLYDDFSGKIVFHGGIDIQDLMPNGSPEEVAKHTRSVIAALHGKEGGYVLSPAHTVQADVPAENILAMIEAAHHA